MSPKSESTPSPPPKRCRTTSKSTSEATVPETTSSVEDWKQSPTVHPTEVQVMEEDQGGDGQAYEDLQGGGIQGDVGEGDESLSLDNSGGSSYEYREQDDTNYNS